LTASIIVYYIKYMSEGITTVELQKEERTLSKYLKDKIDVSLVLFVNLSRIKQPALYKRWTRERGRVDIRNAVFWEYMNKDPKLKKHVDKFNKL